jgi:alkylated DNA repair dioxygenase AlkB
MPRASALQSDLFGATETVPGFVYREEAVAAAEARALVDEFAALPFRPFDFHGHLGNRRMVSFGWRYDYSGRALRPSDPLPCFLEPLRTRAAAQAGVAEEAVQHALVTEYAPGAGIGWHRDKPVFAEVIAFSFCSACRLRFRRRGDQGWERRAVMVQPRSVYMLRGPARSEWEHSIPAGESLRYSVTFRTLRAAPADHEKALS